MMHQWCLIVNETLIVNEYYCKKSNFKSTKANLFRDPKIFLRDSQFEKLCARQVIRKQNSGAIIEEI